MPLQTAEDLMAQENNNQARATATTLEVPSQIQEIQDLYATDQPPALQVLKNTTETLSHLRNYTNNPSPEHIKKALDEAKPLAELLAAEVENTKTAKKPDDIRETGYYNNETPITVSILAAQIVQGLNLTREYTDDSGNNVNKLSKMVTILANMNSLHERKIQALATILESYMVCLLIAIKQEDFRRKSARQGYWTPGLGRK